MQYDRAYAFLMPKLEKELPPHFTYHNAQHTKEVIEAVELLAGAENVAAHERELLRTAALFHDAGFLEGYDNHEESSCRIASEHLPQFGYQQHDVAEICRLIMATRITQKPADKLEAMLCDADLSYLGTDLYFPRAEALFIELQSAGKLKTWEEWQQVQLKFIEGHRYYTPTAVRLYTPKKSHNFLLFKSGVRHTENRTSKRMHALQDFALILLGVLSAAFGLKSFLVPAHFFDGGITGVALVLYSAFGFNLSVTTFLLNLPFVIASYFIVSRSFAMKAFIGVLLLALCLLFLPEQSITQDKLLIAFFGGFFIGIGSGLAIRGGAVLDGTEVLALYTLRLTNFTITEIILAINIVIFGMAALVKDVESAFYSVLTYIVASRTIHYVVEGFEAYTGVTIISGQSEVLKSRLVNELRRSITVYKGERGYLPGNLGNTADCDIIFTVISRLELRKLKKMVFESDPNAFVFANTINEAAGGILKNNRLHG
jgi:uncharacterized membrane-anchored protein YitT (DUF2179 family)